MPPAPATGQINRADLQARFHLWLRLAALALAIAALGLPINDLWRYALLAAAVIVIFSGVVMSRTTNWLLAGGAVALCLALKLVFPAPLVEEGHNVFIVDAPGGALEHGLPADAYRQMLATFNERYPAGQRCAASTPGCWRGGGFPERAYAFSADAVYDRAALSRRTTTVDHDNPVWARLGFINELRYNWTDASDIRRGARHPRNLLNRWSVTMPYFVMFRFPPAFVGSTLCFQGDALWETSQQRYLRISNAEPACKAIETEDVGRSIYGLSIGKPLSMTLNPTLKVQLHGWLSPALSFIAILVVLLALVRQPARRWLWPAAAAVLALLVVFLNDPSFIGGIRPFDGGDDGLFYEGVARQIVQHVLAGDWRQALIGGEAVFYYGGPGLRYLRAIEHFIFGDSFLGYLAIVLTMPLLVYAALKRFLGARAAFQVTLLLFILPLGGVFGSTLFQYAKWAARGFADPAAACALLAGIIVLIGREPSGPSARFAPAVGAGLLFALALFLRPNLALATAVFLTGAALMALQRWQIARVAGLCLGFLPVFGMALHNWAFGGVFVLFSSNATIAEALPMPPSKWLTATFDFVTLHWASPAVKGAIAQLAFWLSGPSGSPIFIPLHAAAIAVLVRIALSGRAFDRWLRLCAAAALAQHAVAWFYLHFERYHHATWLLTLIVCAVWVRNEGLALAQARFPRAFNAVAGNAPLQFAGHALGRLADRLSIKETSAVSAAA
ncbi:MAG: hypothetical protein AB7O50_09900 [Pseudolabrys sp.]